MKWLLIGLGIAAAVVGTFVFLLVGTVCALTGPMVKSAEDFLADIGSGRFQAAYESASPEFKAAVTPTNFEAVMKNLGLDAYKSVAWGSRSVRNDLGELFGAATLANGEKVSLHMQLKRSDRWRVTLIENPDRQAPKVTIAIPSKENATVLVRESLLEFDAAVKSSDFSRFYSTISRLWQGQTSPDRLKSIFQAFIDKEADLSGVQRMNPVFDPEPVIDADGRLLLQGRFDSTPMRLEFTLGYIEEAGEWRLVKLAVDLKPAG